MNAKIMKLQMSDLKEACKSSGLDVDLKYIDGPQKVNFCVVPARRSGDCA